MVVGTEWGRVRSLRGTGGRPVEEVLPGQPAEISGLKGLPQAGDLLLVRRKGGGGEVMVVSKRGGRSLDQQLVAEHLSACFLSPGAVSKR